MSQSLAHLLREAYATGWAASGGPMTDRVRAGCTAAVSLGVEYPHRPGLLEATLHLGHLEGIWATIYARRDDLHAHNRTAVATVWHPLVADLDLPTLIRHVRRDAGLHEAVSKATIGRIVDAVLNLLNQVRHRTGWRQLRQAVRDALARSLAEGRADAVALAVDAAHHIAIDFAIPFADAYRALEHAQELLTEADEWLLRIIGDQASVLGRQLAILTRDGASYADMLDAARSVLEGSDPEAVGLVVDQLTARALSQGALDLYRVEGVEQVDFLSAGDGRVCKTCSDAEANNPYPPNRAPVPGLHLRCRCTVVARDPLPTAVATYLKGA